MSSPRVRKLKYKHDVISCAWLLLMWLGHVTLIIIQVLQGYSLTVAAGRASVEPLVTAVLPV